MNTITFELIDTKSNKHKVSIASDCPKLEIDDAYVSSLCEQLSITELAHCFMTLGANNMALIIKDYTLTKSIHINGFYNTGSYLSMLQSINCNLHVTGQQIKHLQADCTSMLLADCSVERLEIGLFKRFEPQKDKKETELFKMENLDLRDSEVKTIDVFAECSNINIQRAHIGEMVFQCGMFTKTAITNSFHIWYNTTIDRLTMSNRINSLKIDASKVSRLYAHSTLLLGNIEIKDSIIEDCYGFTKTNFLKDSYDSWSWISKSAQNSMNTQMKADATYEMLKSSCTVGKKPDKFFGKVFDWCAGYGYKPVRIIRASGMVVIFSTIIYSVLEFFTILSKHSIPLNCDSLVKAIIHIWNNLLVSVAAFVGQSGLSPSDGMAYWLSTFEYLSGIILFAMFVNALYLRYKE